MAKVFVSHEGIELASERLPSGCGKSSLVRAGLLPVMAGEPAGGRCHRSCPAPIQWQR